MMAPLPPSRIEHQSCFTHTGIVFGPFTVCESKSTRRTKGTKKMWCLLLTCRASRVIHVELLPGLDTSSLANAIRRFTAIRGYSVRHIYSDRGTNFLSVYNQSTLIETPTVLGSLNLQWHFNPPHASHYGGA